MNFRILARTIVVSLIIAAAIMFYASDMASLFTVEQLVRQLDQLKSIVATYPLKASVVYFFVYLTMTALCLPGTGPLTLLAGALFEMWWGVILVSFASSIGACLAFLSARFVFRDSLEKNFKKLITYLNVGIRRNGIWYLLALRLVPIFPFVLVNLGLGLTALPLTTFFWGSKVGMLPVTVIYVWAGKRLAQIRDWSDLLTPEVLVLLGFLAIVPLAFRLWFHVTKKRFKSQSTLRPLRRLSRLRGA